MTFTQEQKDLVIGTLLGDASLSTETKGRIVRKQKVVPGVIVRFRESSTNNILIISIEF